MVFSSLGSLALVALPYVHNILSRTLSQDLTAVWVPSYLDQLHPATQALRLLGQGPGLVAQHLYGDGRRAAIFEQLSYFDLVLALVATALATVVISTTMIIPEGERFTATFRRRPAAGSWPLAGFLVVVAIGVSCWIWYTATRSGSLFHGVNYHCVQYSGPLFSKHRRCLAAAESTFPETIDQLGWTLSVASAVMITLFSAAIFAVRTAWRKSRSRRAAQS